MNPLPINRLMTAVVQIQDEDEAINALSQIGLTANRLSSSGGFLGRQNVTLLIGLSAGQEQSAIAALSHSCRRRVEYIATSLEGAPFHLPLSTPVMVGGATVFTIKIDRYEVF
jgi:uncharacterized protein YaaQ